MRDEVPPTVLLVDDEYDVRLLWRMVFELHGGFGTISEADSGDRALEMLGVGGFDVVVTDYSMPGASGFEVVDATRARWPSAVVVMVSGTADVGAEALRRGASAYFDKCESTTDRMPGVVRALLEQARSVPGSRIAGEVASQWPGHAHWSTVPVAPVALRRG